MGFSSLQNFFSILSLDKKFFLQTLKLKKTIRTPNFLASGVWDQPNCKMSL